MVFLFQKNIKNKLILGGGGKLVQKKNERNTENCQKTFLAMRKTLIISLIQGHAQTKIKWRTFKIKRRFQTKNIPVVK